jgi:hypothetical protein
MGINRHHYYHAPAPVQNLNPDPKNFIIEKIDPTFVNFMIVLVKYPNCTNYKGKKILVYQNLSLVDFMNLKAIDPHFSESGISPIARFAPTDEGWAMAVAFVNAIS